MSILYTARSDESFAPFCRKYSTNLLLAEVPHSLIEGTDPGLTGGVLSYLPQNLLIGSPYVLNQERILPALLKADNLYKFRLTLN